MAVLVLFSLQTPGLALEECPKFQTGTWTVVSQLPVQGSDDSTELKNVCTITKDSMNNVLVIDTKHVHGKYGADSRVVISLEKREDGKYEYAADTEGTKSKGYFKYVKRDTIEHYDDEMRLTVIFRLVFDPESRTISETAETFNHEGDKAGIVKSKYTNEAD